MLQGEIDIPLFSAYVSRGQVSNDEPVIEPSLTFSKGAFSINFWGNYNLTARVTEDPDVSEFDAAAQYTLPLGIEGAAASAGILYYTFPNTNDAPSTTELYFTASYSNDLITPAVEAYFDVDEADGAYVMLQLQRELELAEHWILTPAVSSGWAGTNYNRYFFNRSTNAANDGNILLRLAYRITDTVAVYGLMAYTWLWNSSIRDGAQELYFDDEDLWGGAGLTAQF